MSTAFSWDAFYDVPVVGIMRNIPQHQVHKIVTLYATSGMTTLEITMNSPGAAELITSLSEEFSGELNIGAGTVCTTEDLDIALEAGAQFIVTPILDKAIIKTCVKANIPVFPGAYTPTEIFKAWQWGASLVKVFPASKLGPEYIKEVLAPLNQVKLLPTGGVSLQNFSQFLKAGATGLGIGSHLFPQQLLANNQWAELGKLYAEFVSSVKEFQLQQQENL